MTETRGGGAEYSYASCETFLERAEHEEDAAFAADLRFGADIAMAVESVGGRALAVGGYVRDYMLEQIDGQPLDSKDIDIEVYGVELDQLSELLSRHGTLDAVGSSFVALKVANPVSGNSLDFSIPRHDSKVAEGHRGFIVTGDPHMTIEEAARRRDLTINSIYMDPLTGELIDPWGGVQDLRMRLLRATDMELFKDDPLRVMRVMQFAGRFNFDVDGETFQMCRTLDLGELPTERIADEWVKLMEKSVTPSTGMQLAQQLGVIDQLHPELVATYSPDQDHDGEAWRHTKRAVDAAAQLVRDEGLSGEERLIVLLGAFSLDCHRACGPEVTRQLLSGLLIKSKDKLVGRILPLVENAIGDIGPPPAFTDKAVRQLAVHLKPGNIYLWNLISQANTVGKTDDQSRRAASDYIYERACQLGVAERPLEPIVQGRDLIHHLQMKPGPHFREILDTLYDAQLGDAFESVEDGIAYYKEHGLKGS